MATRQTLYFTAGDGETRIFEYTNPDGTPINITGFTAAFSTTGFDTDITLMTSPAVVVDGSAGKVTVNLTAAQTTSLSGPKKWYGGYRVSIDSGSTEPQTLARGTLVVL